MKISKEKLKELLQQAKQAHHQYVQNSDDADNDWAQWYANYIENKVNNS